jgi:hypothetical protein
MRPTHDSRSRTRTGLLTLLSGAGGAALCGVVSTSGVPWVAKLLLLTLAALIVPTASNLSGRILVATVTLFGTSLFVWCLPLDPHVLTHGVLLSLLVGALGGGATALAWRRGEIGSLVPKVAWVDALPVASGLLSLVQLRRVFLVSDVSSALRLTLEHWDNSSHLYITGLLRRFGRLQIFDPPSFDGSSWGFANYPSGFQSTIASVMDVMLGSAPSDPGSDLIAFWHADALLLALVSAGCVAAVTATLVARARPLVGMVAGAWAVALFLVGPGFFPLVDGHQNIPVCYLGVAAVFSAVLSADRVWRPREFAVTVGGVITAAGSWAPLGALAAVAALGIALPVSRARWAAPRAQIASCAAIAAIGVGALVAITAWATMGVSGNFLVTALGGVTTLDGGLQLQVAVATCVAWAGAVVLAFRTRRPALVRLAFVGIAAVGALLLYLLLAHQQIQAFGEMRYYAQKLGVSSVSVGLVFLTFGALYLAPASDTMKATPLQRRLVAVALIGSSAVAFGSPYLNPYFNQSAAPGVQATMAPPTSTAEGPLVAMLAASRTVSADTQVVALSPKLGPTTSALCTVALASVRGMYTNQASELITKVVMAAQAAEMASVAADLVTTNPRIVVVTDSTTQAEVSALVSADQRTRVLSYD